MQLLYFFAMCSVHRISTVCSVHQSYAESVENCDAVEFLLMSIFKISIASMSSQLAIIWIEKCSLYAGWRSHRVPSGNS